MVLEHVYMFSVHCPHILWQQIEDSGPSYPQRILRGFPDKCWSFRVNMVWDDLSPSADASRCENHIIPRDQPLADFPQENYLIPISSALLRVDIQIVEFFPVVHATESVILYSVH